MAYLALRYYLQRRRTPLRVVASVTGININRLYNLTSKVGVEKFTQEEMDLIWEHFCKDGAKTKEEVFKYEVLHDYGASAHKSRSTNKR